MKQDPAPEPPAPGALAPGRTRAQLVEEVTAALARIPRGARVVAAVSGGPDSTACVFLSGEARPDLQVVLAHVRHGLREDRHDVATVETQASWLGLELDVVEVAVEPTGRGVEADARSQRYAALRRVARSHEAGWLLVGHTADDQAETLLLRLARGTGVPGLAGMAPVRGDVVRPLLRVRRADVHRFVDLEGLPVAHDPTNDDLRYARNVVRHRVLPRLGEVAGDPVGALVRLADLARDDARALDDLAATRTDELAHRLGPVVSLPQGRLAEQPVAVVRRVVRAVVREVRGGGDPPTAGEVEAVRLLDQSALDLPGVVVTAAGGWVAVGPAELPAVEPVALHVPGATAWGVLGCRIDAVTPGIAHDDQRQSDEQLRLGGVEAWRPPDVRVDPRVLPPGANPELAQVALGGLEDPTALVARTRRPGDRVATAGGTRKLQDVHVDAGVPRQLRDLLPVVATDDRVLWVPGLAVDEPARLAGLVAPQVHLAVVRAGTRRPPGAR